MSEKVNIREVLEGLETETRKASQDEICVYMTSKFEPELHVGLRGVDTRVLTPDASMTLLERLNAELRVPRKGDRVLLEDGKWVTSAYDYTVPAICEKQPKPVKPEPKYREFRTPQEVLAWVQEHGQIVVNKNGDWSTITHAGIYGIDGKLSITGLYGMSLLVNSIKSAKDGTPFGVLE